MIGAENAGTEAVPKNDDRDARGPDNVPSPTGTGGTGGTAGNSRDSEAAVGEGTHPSEGGAPAQHPEVEAEGSPPELDFDKLSGLITAVAQDVETLEVRMVGFMNRTAWERTLETGYAHYYSRSRDRLWKKGETSGNVQEVREIRVDCDQDAVVLLVRQVGDVTCHTGNRSCFYRRIEKGRLVKV